MKRRAESTQRHGERHNLQAARTRRKVARRHRQVPSGKCGELDEKGGVPRRGGRMRDRARRMLENDVTMRENRSTLLVGGGRRLRRKHCWLWRRWRIPGYGCRFHVVGRRCSTETAGARRRRSVDGPPLQADREQMQPLVPSCPFNCATCDFAPRHFRRPVVFCRSFESAGPAELFDRSWPGDDEA